MDVRLERAYEPELRRWFAHDPARFDELRRRARTGTLTLVAGALDAEHNDAVVLAEILRRGRRS